MQTMCVGLLCADCNGGSQNSQVLSEVRKPQKTLKKGAFSALGLVTMLYILTNVAYLGALTKQEMKDASNTVAVQFFNKAFGGEVAATRVLPGLIALSSFGNVIVVTFVASLVKAEIAKEGILPFSRFFATNIPTVRSRFFRRKVSDTEKDPQMSEHTPAGALLLHWTFSMIIVVSPPVGDTYTFFLKLYSYTNDIWFGVFLASGLLWLRFKRDSNWVKESSFKPWGGPTMTIMLLVFYLFLIVAPFIPPAGKTQLSTPSIKWYVFPVVGNSVFLGGVLYWLGLRFVWPKLFKRELYVDKKFVLDGDQIDETVTPLWVRVVSACHFSLSEPLD
jgi:amino acid transporter